MAPRSDNTLSAAARLELHMVRDFVRGYIERSLRGRTAGVIDPGKLISAARFSGIKAPSRVVMQVLDELAR